MGLYPPFWEDLFRPFPPEPVRWVTLPSGDHVAVPDQPPPLDRIELRDSQLATKRISNTSRDKG